MLKRLFAIVLLLGSVCYGLDRQKINFPDIEGYKTLKCDFHMHTVISDGQVSPQVRVNEAWLEGLDAISITDHIEYQPNKVYVSTELNRVYDMAKRAVGKKDLILIEGAEMTHNKPKPWHFNCLFINDPEKFRDKNILEQAQECKKQGGLLTWNHPSWKGPENGQWDKPIQQLYELGLLHAIEAANGSHIQPDGVEWAHTKDLAWMGCSDIHSPSGWIYPQVPGHRTITLILAKEKTAESIKEAMLARRTIAWANDMLLGPEKHLREMFNAAVKVGKAKSTDKGLTFELTNNCDVPLKLKHGDNIIDVPANGKVMVKTDKKATAGKIELQYKLTNFIWAPEKSLDIKVVVELE